MSKTVSVLLVAEIKVDDGDLPVRRASETLNTFREATLPSENYDVTLYTATRKDLKKFSFYDSLLPEPKPIVE